MTCNIRYRIVEDLELKGLARKEGSELIRTAPEQDIDRNAALMSMDLAREYGENDVPYMSVGDKVILNDDMIKRIDRIMGNENVLNSDLAQITSSEQALVSSMRNVMKKFGVSEKVVDTLRDRNGNPISGVAAADILGKTIQVVNGNESELTEEVIHFMVVAMKDLDDPLYRSMAKRIFSEPEYSEVKNDPNYRSLGYSEEDIIDEAITKVIVNRLKKEVKEDRNTRWWKRFLDRFKELFSMKKDPFRKAAEAIFHEDLSNYRDAISISERSTIFRSVKGVQDQARELLMQRHEDLSLDEKVTRDVLEGKMRPEELELFEQGDGTYVRYRYKGQLVTRRASDPSSLEFMRSFRTFEEYKKKTKEPRSKASRDAGTDLHGIAREVMLHLAESREFKKHFNVVATDKDLSMRSMTKLKKDSGLDSDFKYMQDSVKSILSDMVLLKGDKGKIDLYTELRIYNEESDTAGTIDVLFILPNGKGQIYDYKFISSAYGSSKKDGDTILTKDPFSGTKGKGYSNQLAFYKRTLERDYGLGRNGVERARLVPGHIELEYSKQVGYTGKAKSLRMGNEADRFLMEYPTNWEKYGDKNIDKEIDRLNNKLQELNNIKRPNAFQIKEREMVMTAIKDILVRDSDLSATIDEIHSTLKYANERLSIKDKKDPNYLNNNDIAGMIQTLGLFADLSSVSEMKFNDLVQKKRITKEEADEFMKRVRSSEKPVSDMIERLVNEGYLRLMERIEETGIETNFSKDIYSMPVSLMWSADMFIAAEDIDNQYFKMFQLLYQDHLGEFEIKAQEFGEKWESLQKDLDDWGKKNGLNRRKTWDLLLKQKEKGKRRKLISVLSNEFKEERNKLLIEASDKDARESKKKALDWMKENYQIKEGAKKDFLEARKEEVKWAESIYRGKSSKGYIDHMARFDQKYNVWGSSDAWISRTSLKYLEVKPEKYEVAFSDQYNFLLKEENAPLLKYYEEWKSDMLMLSKRTKESSIGVSFVPNVMTDVVQGAARGMNPVSVLGKNILRDISIEVEDEEQVGKEIYSNIPLMYLNPPRNESGEIDSDMISTDLTNSMIRFARSAFKNEQMKNLEGHVEILKQLLLQTQEVEISNGKLVKLPGTDELQLKDVSSNTIAAFEKLKQEILYGASVTDGVGSTPVAEIKGRTVTFGKLATLAKNIVTAQKLTLPFGAATAAMVSRWLFRGTKYHENTNLSKQGMKEGYKAAFDLMKTDPKKFKGLMQYLNVYQVDELMMQERKSRGDVVSRYMNMDVLLSALVWADEFGDTKDVLAMMHTLGSDEKGNLKSLKDLPEGSKNLYSKIKFNKDGSVKKNSLSDKEMKQLRMRFFSERKDMIGSPGRYSHVMYHSNTILGLAMQFKGFFAGLLKAKWGNTKWNVFKDSLETGTYKAFFKAAKMRDLQGIDPEDLEAEIGMRQTLLNTLTSLKGMVSTMVRLSNYTVSVQERKERLSEGKWSDKDQKEFERRRKWIEREHRIVTENTTDPNLQNVSVDDFAVHMQNKIRGSVEELRSILGLFVMALIAARIKPEEDDDGQIMYSYNMYVYLLQRIMLETSAFINPVELLKLNKNLIPALSLLQDATNIASNGVDVLADLIAYGKTTSPNDRTGWMHYTLYAVPGSNNISRILGENR